MKKTGIGTIILKEFISNGIGWIAGLLAANLVSSFFVAKKFSNLWGLGTKFTDKTAVSAPTLNIIEWLTTAIIGYFVLLLVNKTLAKWLLKSLETKEEEK